MSKNGKIAIKRPFLDPETKDIWTINNYNYSKPVVQSFNFEDIDMNLYINAKFAEGERIASCFEFGGLAEAIITPLFNQIEEKMQYPEMPKEDKDRWEKEHVLINKELTSQLIADTLDNFKMVITFSPVGTLLEEIKATFSEEKILIIADEKNFMLELDQLEQSIKFLAYQIPNINYILFPLISPKPNIIDENSAGSTDNIEEIENMVWYMKIYFSTLLESITKKCKFIGKETTKMLLQIDNKIIFSNQVAFNKGFIPSYDSFQTLCENEEANKNYYRYNFLLNEGNKTIDVQLINCLSGDTLIQISKDGKTKPIKDIKIGDYVYTPSGIEQVIYSDSDFSHATAKSYYLFTFEDGRQLKIIKNHRFLNPKNNKFEHILDRQVGDYLIDNNKKLVKIIKIELIEEEINHYTIFTENTNQYYANGFLSGNKVSKFPFKWLRKIGLKYCKHYYGW